MMSGPGRLRTRAFAGGARIHGPRGDHAAYDRQCLRADEKRIEFVLACGLAAAREQLARECGAAGRWGCA